MTVIAQLLFLITTTLTILWGGGRVAKILGPQFDQTRGYEEPEWKIWPRMKNQKIRASYGNHSPHRIHDWLIDIFKQDDHFRYRNCYQQGSCVHNTKDSHNITYERQPQHWDHPTLIRIVCGFFNVPQNYKHSRNSETGPPAYRPYPRRLESLTICRWNYKGSTFLLSYLKTLSVGPVGVSNSRPPTSQPGAQPIEPLLHGGFRQIFRVVLDLQMRHSWMPWHLAIRVQTTGIHVDR